jgi:hypothetical protein
MHGDAGDVATSSRSGNAADARRSTPEGCLLANFLFPILSFAMILRCAIRQQNVKLFMRRR